MTSMGVIRTILSLGKTYFPEVSETATLINAPWVFSKMWLVVKPLLTPVMRSKVCILGEDWEQGLKAHSGMDRAQLPVFLGGMAPDEDVCKCEAL